MSSFISSILFPPADEPQPQSHPVVRPSLRLRLVKILLTSSALHQVLPEVRLRAFIESASGQEGDDAVREFVVDTLCNTSYLSDEKKTAIVEHCLNEDWDQLATSLNCQSQELAPYENLIEPNFERFRAMVVCIFSRSKKIQSLPVSRIRQLGAFLHSATSIDQLMELTIQSLQQSVVFGSSERDIILNDILDKRYDLLLLPSRFDCEEVAVNANTMQAHLEVQSQRQVISPTAPPMCLAEETKKEDDVEECPVCLGVEVVDTRLPCAHRVCQACVTDWVRVQGEPCPCPMCREEFTLAACTRCAK